MRENKNHIDEHDNVQSLIDLMENLPENFEHLQIFLSREGKSNCLHDNMFLMISPTSFGKLKLLNVSVDDNFVILEIKDCITMQVGNVRIDVSDSCPQTFFINWKDVKNMVLGESKIFEPKHKADDLLEFCF